MGKSKDKKKKAAKAKAKTPTKLQPSKRSKFSLNHNDNFFHAPKNPPGSGNPTAYLYGKDATNNTKKGKKRQRPGKRNSQTSTSSFQKHQNNTSHFVPRKTGKRGKRIFIARFPVIGTKSKRAPWFKEKKNGVGNKENKNNKKSSGTQRKLLNGTFSVDETALQHLNDELQEFATYVTLTPIEIKAREYLIREIRTKCRNLFGVEESQCKVFGSFAAQPVCIFESDIDLAIWGVVEPDNNSSDEDVYAGENGNRKDPPSNNNDNDEEFPNMMGKRIAKRFDNRTYLGTINEVWNKGRTRFWHARYDDGDEEDLNRHELKAAISLYHQQKQEKVLKWKELIDNATSVVNDSDSKPQEKKDGKAGEDSKVGEAPLFVLDRTGEESSSDVKAKENTGSANALIDNATSVVDESDSKPKAKTNEEPGEDGQAGETPFFVLDRTGEESSSDLNEKNTGSTNQRDDDENENSETTDNEDKDSPYVWADSNDSNSDSADKLENFWSRKRARSGSLDNDDDEEEEEEDAIEEGEEKVDFNDVVPRGRPRGQSLVSLSSDTTCSVEANLDESGMEVSFVVEADNKPPTSAQAGPTGATRTKVVKALYKLTKKLGPLAKNIEVRRRARVPIINMVTRFGFECDIALGGHNGTDTSSYATTQLSRFKSFSTLVVFLKVLLNYQGLDKPFTGGLGSYALYVLVASHIEQHLETGGTDDPAELLFAFFFRYGGVKHNTNKLTGFRTQLSQYMVVTTKDGGFIDLKSCFQIENCETIFENCWRILQKRLKGKFSDRFSILQYMVDAEKLRNSRGVCKFKIKNQFEKISEEQQQFTAAAAIPRVAGLPPKEKKDTNGDREARELIQGYGADMQRFLPVEQPATKKKRKSKKSNKKKRQKLRHAASVAS